MECDYPGEVDRLPKLTRSNIPPGLSSEQIDTVVNGVGVTYKTLERIDVVVGRVRAGRKPSSGALVACAMTRCCSSN
jgi:hypothetical protein